jgi:hypothetical protein
MALAETHLPMVTAYVRAYVRDRGFEPSTGEPRDDLAAVIVASSARLMANPAPTLEQSVGPFSVKSTSITAGPCPNSRLHRYRKRAANYFRRQRRARPNPQ